MSYVLRFSPDAEKELKKWKKSAPKLFKKLSEVLSELIIHPKQGIGHPEALKVVTVLLIRDVLVASIVLFMMFTNKLLECMFCLLVGIMMISKKQS